MALIAHWPLDGRLDDVIGKNNLRFYNNINNVGVGFVTTNGLNGTSFFRTAMGVEDGLVVRKDILKLSYKNLKYENFSIFFRFKLSSLDKENTRYLFKIGESVVGYQLYMYILSYDDVDFRINIGSSSTSEKNKKLVDNLRVELDIDVWYSMSLTFGYKGLTLYLNDTEIHNSSIDEHIVQTFNDNYYSLGNQAGFIDPLHGYIESFRLYDHCLTYSEILDILKFNVLKLRFNEIETKQYNYASSQTNIYSRNGINISNYEKIKGWNFAKLSGITSEGRGRKGIFRIPVSGSIDNSLEYSIGIDFRIMGDDIKNYDLDVISNNMAGNPTYTPSNVIGDRYFFEKIKIVGSFDICFYSKSDDFNLPPNLQIMWKNIQLEPYSKCTEYVDSEKGSNLIKDSSEFRNDVTVEGSFEPPRYSNHDNTLEFNLNGNTNTTNKLRTRISMNRDILNDSTYEVTMLCRIRVKDISGYGAVMGSVYYQGLGIAIHNRTICAYMRDDVETNHYIYGDKNTNDGEFHSVGFIFSRILGKVSFYLDGEVFTRNIKGKFNGNLNNKYFDILASIETAGSGVWLSGKIEVGDIQIFRTALTKTEINETFSRELKVTESGSLNYKYYDYEKNNLVCLDPIEYIDHPTNTNRSESSSEVSVLLRGRTNDSYSRRFPLKRTIYTGSKIKVTFDTVISDGVEDDIDVEVHLFSYRITDQGRGYRFLHKLSDGEIKSHVLEISFPFDINWFRVDVNNSKASVLFKNLKITVDSVDVNNALSSFKLIHGRVIKRTGLFQTNLIDYSTWKVNSIGSIGNFDKNGTDLENKRSIKLNPWGNFDIVWESESNDSDSNSDGGFNYRTVINVDYKKKYRCSVWVRIENVGDGSGNIYFGPSNANTPSSNVIKFSQGSEVVNTNPYWFSSRLPLNDEWLLMVAYIYPYSETGDVIDDSGLYDINGSLVGSMHSKYKFSSTVTKAMIRSYLFYSTKVDERCYWYRPRMDLCNGTEPTIDDLLKGREHGSIVEALGKFNPTFPPDEQFLEIKRAHGARWGKIFYHNNKAGTVLFSNDINEFLRCNTEDKKSILYALPYMRDKDYKFEFLLEYDSFEGYNRWKQTSVFTDEVVSGYEAISISWSGNYWGGLEPCTHSNKPCFVDGSVNSTDWWYAIGCKVIYSGSMPGPGAVETAGVHLWLRLPEVAFITQDNTLIVNDIERP